MERREIYDEITEKFAGILLNWAVKKTGNRQDGEDLAQEVLLQVFISVAKGNEILKMENFIWKVAHHVWCNHLRRIKRARDIMPVDETIPDRQDVIEDFLDRESLQAQISGMRRKLADLSIKQRETMILHYLDGLSVRRVAERLGLSESAVKKHLFDARNTLKRELGEMKTDTSYVYQPGRLVLGVSGLLPEEPDTVKVNDNLMRQNILLLCYRTPKNVNELAELTGIPKPYLESELDWLENREFLSVEGKKYSTIIPVIGRKHRQDIGELYRDTRGELIDVITDYLWGKEAEIRETGFYGADFQAGKLMWSVIMMFLSYFSRNSKTAVRLKQRDEREIRPDGGKYYVIGNDLSDNQDINPDGYFKPEGWKDFYGICSDSCASGGKYDSYYWLGLYNFTDKEYHPEIVDEDNVLVKRAWHSLYCSLIAPDFSVDKLSEEEKEMLAAAVQKGFVEKTGGEYKPAFVIMTASQFEEMQERVYKPLLEKIEPECEKLAEVISGMHAQHIPRANKRYINYLTYLDLWYMGIYAYIFAADDGKLYIPEAPEQGALLTLVLVT